MPRLIIGNLFTDEIAGDPRLLPASYLRVAAAGAQMVLWFAKDGDIILLPERPDDAVLDYVTRMTGTDRSTLRIIVPPPGMCGTGLLTADRMADPGFREELAAALDGVTVRSVIPMTPDTSVATLATDFGFEDAVPGHAFLSQGGSVFVNSKAIFRTVAAGAGVPIPAGGVCTHPVDAHRMISRLFDQDLPVMLKRDFCSGGYGNEVVSKVPGLEPVGANRSVVLPDSAALEAYLQERWDWLSNGGRYAVVVEQYVPGSRAIYAECQITDDGPVFLEQGEMFSAPVTNAQVIPPPDLPRSALTQLITATSRLCDALRAVGYRGPISADAILAPDGRILFTEYNGRITGSTHAHMIIGNEIVGPNFSESVVIAEYCEWTVPSYQAAVQRLDESGLTYDPATKRGVVLTKAHNEANGLVRYCAIAENLAGTARLKDKVESLFAERSA
jgi:Pre ATP-grasp domain/PGM1 C-terminal domain